MSKKPKNIDPNATREADLKFYQKFANIALFSGLFFFFGLSFCYALRETSDWLKFILLLLIIGAIFIGGALVLVGFLVFCRCRKLEPDSLDTAKLLIGAILCLLSATLAPTVFGSNIF